MNYQREIKHNVIEELDKEYSNHLLDFSRCKVLQQTFLAKKYLILDKVDITNTNSFNGKIVFDAQNFINSVQISIDKAGAVINHIKDDLSKIDDVRKTFQCYSDKINTLKCTLQYMRVLQHIECLRSELQRELGRNNDEKCVTIFVNLTEISRNLINGTGIHLYKYLKAVIYYWHNILKDKLAKDFDEVLKAIKWPFVSTNVSLTDPLPSQICKFQTIAEYLLQIELPSEICVPHISSALLSDFPPLCLPIHYLVLPLRKRFIYHFHGSRQTNRADKPEWYFTQILTWIRDHRTFIVTYIQPVIDKLGLHHIDAQLELIRGLVQICVEKLYSELPNIQYDDFIFSHSVDEALGFDRELRENYDYPSNQPGILTVLIQAQVFIKWLAMEKKYATEKMDAMLPPNSTDAFKPLTSDVEDLKITTCADAFITLLQTIKERYESLPQPGHRLQFLELQLELLDDFRVRLLQLVNAEKGDIIESKISSIASSIYYIENILTDWSTMLHYLNLYYYKKQLEDKDLSHSPAPDFRDSPTFDIDKETVFTDTLFLYRHMREDLLKTLAETLMREINARSKDYLRERWSAIVVEKEFRSLSLTPTACPMFEILSKRLHQLQKNLPSQLFNYVWHLVAKHMDTYLFENLVLENRFNEGGALQFKFDVTRNLIPLFSQFSERPHNYFIHSDLGSDSSVEESSPRRLLQNACSADHETNPTPGPSRRRLIESCNLLNISKGTALLLIETIISLEGATGVEDIRCKALQEIGVIHFTPKMAFRVLSQRADITTNRLLID